MGFFSWLFPKKRGRTFACSACFEIYPLETIHIIPWWNEDSSTFFTTYRCNGCWKKSLDETVEKVKTWNEQERQIFCVLLDRHKLPQFAQHVRDVSLEESRTAALMFLEKVRSGDEVLGL